MAEGDGSKTDDISELKHNLKVSFSRMKDDIHFNRQQVEDLLKANQLLMEQVVLSSRMR
jgi:hypothetical protein